MLRDNLVIWASFPEAWYSSSAGTILARRWRSTSAAFAMTRIEKKLNHHLPRTLAPAARSENTCAATANFLTF